MHAWAMNLVCCALWQRYREAVHRQHTLHIFAGTQTTTQKKQCVSEGTEAAAAAAEEEVCKAQLKRQRKTMSGKHTSSLSLRPSLTSGMPLRNTFITILPFTSHRNTVPLLLISMFTCSHTASQQSATAAVLFHQESLQKLGCKPPAMHGALRYVRGVLGCIRGMLGSTRGVLGCIEDIVGFVKGVVSFTTEHLQRTCIMGCFAESFMRPVWRCVTLQLRKQRLGWHG